MNLIAAVDNEWGIGCQGELLYRIPDDMKFFKSTTINKIVVMGHSTLKSFPNAKPLKERVNIVMSKNKDLKIDGAIVCNDLDSALKEISRYNSDDIFIIGGQAIYELFLEHCEYAYVTKINSTRKADSYFPNLDNWEIVEKSETKYHDNIEYEFVKYKNPKAPFERSCHRSD